MKYVMFCKYTLFTNTKHSYQKNRDLHIDIRPEIPQKKKLEDQYSLVRNLAESEYKKSFLDC